jgi:hypothetical protein
MIKDISEDTKQFMFLSTPPSFLTSALDGGKWSTSRPDRFALRKNFVSHSIESWREIGCFREERKI